MSGILRQWSLSLHRKTAKLLNMARSGFTNFENIAKKREKKIFY